MIKSPRSLQTSGLIFQQTKLCDSSNCLAKDEPCVVRNRQGCPLTPVTRISFTLMEVLVQIDALVLNVVFSVFKPAKFRHVCGSLACERSFYSVR